MVGKYLKREMWEAKRKKNGENNMLICVSCFIDHFDKYMLNQI